jgi:hypothetical protein
MSDQLRLSDAERELAAADLGEHFAQGRLSNEEHAERLDQIWAARTRGEIAPIFRDLPSAYSPRARETSGSTRRSPVVTRSSRGWSPGYPPFLLVLALLIVVSFFTHFPVIIVGLLVWFVVVKRAPWRHRRWH